MLGVTGPRFSIWNELKQANKSDPYLLGLHDNLQTNPNLMQRYQVREGILLFKNRAVIPPSSDLKSILLKEFHDTKIACHSGTLRTLKRLSQNFYWVAMKRDVQEHVAAYDICQRNKSDSRSLVGLLQPLPVPTKVWEDISLDFIDGLPISVGKDSILVVVDRLTKYAHFIALRHPYSASLRSCGCMALLGQLSVIVTQSS